MILQFYMGTFCLLPRLQLPPGQVSSLPIPHHLENFSLPDMFSYSKEGTSFSLLGDFTWPGDCTHSKRKLAGLTFYFSPRPLKGKHINDLWVFLSVRISESLHFFTAPSTPAVLALKLVLVFQLKSTNFWANILIKTKHVWGWITSLCGVKDPSTKRERCKVIEYERASLIYSEVCFCSTCFWTTAAI